jgi:hypothetical protein
LQAGARNVLELMREPGYDPHPLPNGRKATLTHEMKMFGTI